MLKDLDDAAIQAEMDTFIDAGSKFVVYNNDRYPVWEGELEKFGLVNGQVIDRALWEKMLKSMLETAQEKLLKAAIVVVGTEGCNDPNCRIHGDDILNADTLEPTKGDRNSEVDDVFGPEPKGGK